MSSLLSMNIHSLGDGQPDTPAPGRLIEGEPRFTNWPLSGGPVATGVWAATPGHHRMIRDRQTSEAFFILEGEVEIFEDGVADARRFGPGDLVIIPPGFTGSWRSLSPVRKVYCTTQQPA